MPRPIFHSSRPAWFGVALAGCLGCAASPGLAQLAAIQFGTNASFTVPETGGVIQVWVSRLYYLDQVSSVDFATSNGTATAGADYTAVRGTLLFPPGATMASFTVLIHDDGLVDDDETVHLVLSNPTNAYLTPYNNPVALVIQDNETPTVVDLTFQPGLGANNDIFVLARQSDGRLLIGGQFTTFDGVSRSRVARLQADGSLDGTFNPGAGANGDIYDLKLQSDGRILIGGSFTRFDGVEARYVARLNPDGTLDPTFDAGLAVNGALRALALQPDGKVLIAGQFTAPGGRVARLTTNGAVDATFTAAVNDNVRALALQEDGKVIIGGQFTQVGGASQKSFARLLPNGGADFTFSVGNGADAEVRAVAVQADGRVLLGGDFFNVQATYRRGIARLQTNGILDPTFDAGADAATRVRAIVPEVDGSVLIGGDFPAVNYKARGRVARLNADGSLNSAFVPKPGADNDIFTVLSQPDGTVLIGGKFTNVNGVARSRIARLYGDSDVPSLQLVSNAVLVAEAGGAVALAVQRNGDTTAAGSVEYRTVEGTASAGADFVAQSGTIEFAPRETLRAIVVPILNDALVEGNEEFSVVLTNQAPGALLAEPTVARVTISDNDFGLEFAATNLAVWEGGGVAVISVRRRDDGGAVTVDFATSDGSALAGSDYVATNGTLTFAPGETIQTFTVALLNDPVAEGPETVNLSLSHPTGGAVLGAARAATLVIDDAPAVLQFQGVQMDVSESPGQVSVFVYRSGRMTGPAGADHLVVGGTATPGTDFTGATGRVTLAEGQLGAWFTLAVLGDGLIEGSETFTIGLTNPASGTIIGPQSRYTIRIFDDDQPLGFSSPTVEALENAGEALVSVQRNDDGTNRVTVDFATLPGGTATPGTDYQAVSGTLVFEGLTRVQTFSVPILNDGWVESSETVALRLSRPTGTAVLGASNALLTILDNDAGLEFATNQFFVNEGTAQAGLTVWRGDDGPFPLTVRFRTTHGSALAGLDYLSQDGTLTFAVGQTSGVVQIPILQDLMPETNETFFVTLTELGPGTSLGSNTAATVTILDDERAGSVDLTFHPPVWEIARGGYFGQPAMAVQPDGKIVLGGDGLLTRLTDTGAVDAGFNHGIDWLFGVYVPCLQPDGKILLGTLSSNDLAAYDCVARLWPDGTRDTNFDVPNFPFDDPGFTGRVRALALEPDGRILIGGSFDFGWSGQFTNAVVRLRTNGLLDPDFRPAIFEPGTFYYEVPATVEAMVRQPDGRIVVGGTFTRVAGVGRDQVARLNVDGSLDPAFPPPGTALASNGTTVVRALALQPDGAILVGGTFTNLHGAPRNHLTRLRADGSVDPGFHSPLPLGAYVRALGLQPDGKILVAGSGILPDAGWGIPTNNIARLHPDGTPDAMFDAGQPPDGPVTDLEVLPNGDVMICGEFHSVNGLDRPLIARLKGDAPSLRFGAPQVTFVGVTLPLANVWPWQQVGLLGSSNLVDWKWLATNRPASNTTTFFDANPAGQTRRFYRARQMGP